MRQGTRRRRLFPVKGVAWIALLIAWAATTHADDDGDEIPFAEAEIFLELNDTDGASAFTPQSMANRGPD